MIKQNINQLEQFEKSLPKTCQCTDELGVTFYRTKNLAKALKYINPNHPNNTQYLIFDLDYSGSVLSWMDKSLPAPNIVAVNPKNDHAHYFYGLESPVHWNHNSSRKSQAYAAAIEKNLAELLDADPCYHGPLAKNPISRKWPVTEFHPHLYELSDLAIDLPIPKKDVDLRYRREPVGLGRNCTVFDVTRFWAYSARREPWFNYEFWSNAVLRKAQGVNVSFANPLGEREVFAIAKSIASWVWVNMDGSGFRLWGDNRRKKSIEVRKAKKEVKKHEILAAYYTYPHATHQQLTMLTGYPRQTVTRLLQEAQNDGN